MVAYLASKRFTPVAKEDLLQTWGYKLFLTEILNYVCRLTISKLRVEDVSRVNIRGDKNTLLSLNLGIILKNGLKYDNMQMHHINEYKDDHDHTPTGNPHVDPRFSHMNKGDKCQKRYSTGI